MIYLSGKLKPEQIGLRRSLGVMVTHRAGGGGSNVGVHHLANTVWAADNGCFTNPNLDIAKYMAWLQKLKPYQRNCLFVTAPDVVGNAAETWNRARDILPLIRSLGYKAALVAQVRLAPQAVDWSAFDVLFIGGTDQFKFSNEVFEIIQLAKIHNKKVHFGRVNSLRRIKKAQIFGGDYADGTFYVFAPDKNYKQIHGWLDQLEEKPTLDFTKGE